MTWSVAARAVALIVLLLCILVIHSVGVRLIMDSHTSYGGSLTMLAGAVFGWLVARL
jgi:hypothetical protein